ncbi:MAG: hypothetical protein AAGH48_04240, partial [Pseudomonadota bacterium]
MAESTSQTATGADDENLSFISNFNDIFLAIGLLMLAAGMTIACFVVLAGFGGITRPAMMAAFALFTGSAGVFWLLAEFFARRKRQTIPGIAIFVVFNGFVVAGLVAAFCLTVFSEQFWQTLDLKELSSESITKRYQVVSVLFGLSGAVASSAFYARFKLPFASAIAAASIIGLPFMAFTAIPTLDDPRPLNYEITIATGVFLFILGIWFDLRDSERSTRFSDNAFWMHFFAAPLILQAAFQPLLLSGGESGAYDFSLAFSAERAAIVLASLLGFAFVSLLINRRALIVAGLLYAGWAIGVLMNNAGLGAGAMAAMTLVLLGGMVVVLGAGWHGIRRVLIAPFPKTGFVA